MSGGVPLISPALSFCFLVSVFLVCVKQRGAARLVEMPSEPTKVRRKVGFSPNVAPGGLCGTLGFSFLVWVLFFVCLQVGSGPNSKVSGVNGATFQRVCGFIKKAQLWSEGQSPAPLTVPPVLTVFVREPDMKPFASSGQALRFIRLFREQALVMSTLSDGRHRGSGREEVPDWRERSRYGCRSSGELRVGLLS